MSKEPGYKIIFTVLAWYSCFQVHAEHALNIIKNVLSMRLKVYKNDNFFGSDFEFCTISLLVMLKY